MVCMYAHDRTLLFNPLPYVCTQLWLGRIRHSVYLLAFDRTEAALKQKYPALNIALGLGVCLVRSSYFCGLPKLLIMEYAKVEFAHASERAELSSSQPRTNLLILTKMLHTDNTVMSQNASFTLIPDILNYESPNFDSNSVDQMIRLSCSK